MNRTVLISGASIAGPALAYWLDQYGFEVTVVEKADAVRGGGYAIDVRGTARDVVDRMGLMPELRKAHVDSQKVSFLEPDGTLIAAMRPEAMTGGAEGLDLEVRRGDLADALYTPIRDKVEFLFGDSIARLDDRGDRVDVVLDSGISRSFDLVIGADGLHSNTRRLVFGPEEEFHSYVGFAFAGFTLPNEFGLSHEGVVWNIPGRTAVLYAHEPDELVHGFLTFEQDEPPYDAFRDPIAQRDLVAAKFQHQGWHVPRLVEAMRTSDSLFFDIVSQIHMPTWSQGRVALVGDAAYATSFMSGQGSSVALVGAYVLAGELATHDNHADAFAAYDHRIRHFVEENQAVVEVGRRILAPTTQALLDTRNQALRASAEDGHQGRAANTGLVLPDYQ
ncbi:FAD-dependent monooxygenase [Kribbella italica]|uniref:2-polyprenyl-6-methoxyphenol hydroxylase-like FAD-dependent oxidoreductase n=1 Tax=Kribbella italica TaxID=1540520 RepID=A0A7W9J346_9ACTN|nr:FAD-dependent monooxygenase [Kribbella italica]MBB5834741.1 2-polyprenyl-6-methoxyphenol hydroxylase-like FAD-dependent oxidoreductase [Kribbella italica]